MQKIDYQVTHNCAKPHCQVDFDESNDQVSTICIEHNHPQLSYISGKHLDKKELEQILENLEKCMYTLELSQILMEHNNRNIVAKALEKQHYHDLAVSKIIAKKLISSQ